MGGLYECNDIQAYFCHILTSFGNATSFDRFHQKPKSAVRLRHPSVHTQCLKRDAEHLCNITYLGSVGVPQQGILAMTGRAEIVAVITRVVASSDGIASIRVRSEKQYWAGLAVSILAFSAYIPLHLAFK